MCIVLCVHISFKKNIIPVHDLIFRYASCIKNRRNMYGTLIIIQLYQDVDAFINGPQLK